MSSRPVVLVAEPMMAQLLDVLGPHYEALPFWREEGRARSADARAIVTASELPIDAALLDSLPHLGLIAVFGAGYDNVDVAAARDRGIAISSGHGANAEDVADHAIGLILAQRRGIAEGDRQLRAGHWTIDARMRTHSLGGARLGIVGMGAIGMAIARRAEAMRMQVGWWRPRDKPELRWPRATSLEALARESDILVVTAQADDSNRGMISAPIVEALGPGGLLVNIARGQLVDEEAVIAALRDGLLGGAALDVFDHEPTDPARWEGAPNCVLTPHIAGATHEAVARMAEMLLANLAAYFAGEPLVSPVI